MQQYLALLNRIVNNGIDKDDRTGVGTRSIFGVQYEFNLQEGFPLLTTKRMFWRGIVHELLWMLKGDTNVKYLNDNGVHIWDEWADKNGELGPVYGKQWRAWTNPTDLRKEVDQIATVIASLKENPNSRRHIVSAWNVTELDAMRLPPCHCLFQFYVNDIYLDCQLYQRSADVFLGVPFNIASYALLTYLIAKHVDLYPGRFIHTFGDVHLYRNHIEAAYTQLNRTPGPLPKVVIDDQVRNLSPDSWKAEYIQLCNYFSDTAIKAEVAV